MATTKKETLSLDLTTLKALHKEASKKYAETNKVFEETDSTEFMHLAEHWLETMNWLKEKIKTQKKKAKK